MSTISSRPSSHPAAPTARRTRGVLAGAALLSLAMGPPNACLGVSPDDDTPSGSGTFADPLIVTRDNLALGGELGVTDPTVSATVSKPFLSDGVWKNLTGHIEILEARQHGWLYVKHLSPILPRNNFTGPGNARYGTRAGTLVHDNIYRIGLRASDRGGDSFNLPVVKYVKLAPGTLVVPVVIVSWSRAAPDPSFQSHFYQGLNLFDFNPTAVDNLTAPRAYFRADNTEVTPTRYPAQVPLQVSNIDSPDPLYFKDKAPDRDELPPDEIWASCGIQFQVVAQVAGTLAADWVNRCSVNGANLPSPKEVTRKWLLNPLLRDYLTNDLQPIYVSYTNLSECSSGLGGFFGSTPGKGNIIEINNTRPRTTTAHELGHALGLDHLVDGANKPVSGNLMRVNPVNGERALTPAQCAAARLRARFYSERYDAFNRAIGRTYSDVPSPPPSGTGGDDDGDIDLGGSSSDLVCCLGGDDVHFAAPGTCTSGQVPYDKCEIVCCSNSLRESRYLCEAQGGTGVTCPSR